MAERIRLSRARGWRLFDLIAAEEASAETADDDLPEVMEAAE